MTQEFTQAFAVDTLTVLDPERFGIKREQSGYLTLTYDGATYERVTLTRLIPFDDEEAYISVSYNTEENEWKEIGVIDRLEKYSDDQRTVIREYLSYKYYIPEILKIRKITDNRMGYLFLDAETTAGEKKIAVNDWWHNFRILKQKILAVTDADGNRYRVSDIHTLDKASYKKLQLFV